MSNLMKILLVVVILGVGYDGYLIANSYSRAETHKKSYEKYFPIVRLVEDGHTFCSGTVISKTAILTAAHCVIEELEPGIPVGLRKNIEIRTPDNEPIHTIANVYVIRSQMDQAILKGDFSKFQIVPYISNVDNLINHKGKAKPMTGCGYPLGGPFHCSSLFYIETIGFMWKMQGTILPGMSGGPVMLEDGSIVATNDAVDGSFSVVSPTYNINMQLPEKK